MFELNTRVELNEGVFGKIIVYGYLHRNKPIPVYIVELDKGFSDPDRTIYVSSIVAIRDNVTEVER
jgi:hypothetical protein